MKIFTEMKIFNLYPVINIFNKASNSHHDLSCSILSLFPSFLIFFPPSSSFHMSHISPFFLTITNLHPNSPQDTPPSWPAKTCTHCPLWDSHIHMVPSFEPAIIAFLGDISRIQAKIDRTLEGTISGVRYDKQVEGQEERAIRLLR